jgi:hypothetical protein
MHIKFWLKLRARDCLEDPGINFEEMKWEGMDWVYLAENRGTLFLISIIKVRYMPFGSVQ